MELRPTNTQAASCRIKAVEFSNTHSIDDGGSALGFGSLGDLFHCAGDYIDKVYGVGDYVLLGCNFDEGGDGRTLTLFFEDRGPGPQ
jgi:hypothetical protein